MYTCGLGLLHGALFVWIDGQYDNYILGVGQCATFTLSMLTLDSPLHPGAHRCVGAHAQLPSGSQDADFTCPGACGPWESRLQCRGLPMNNCSDGGGAGVSQFCIFDSNFDLHRDIAGEPYPVPEPPCWLSVMLGWPAAWLTWQGTVRAWPCLLCSPVIMSCYACRAPRRVHACLSMQLCKHAYAEVDCSRCAQTCRMESESVKV